MKTLEELGISPTPWSVEVDSEYGDIEVSDRTNHTIAQIFSFEPKPDSRIIAAAPKMYEELRQEMERRYCVKCKHSVWTKRGGIEIMTGCDGKGACPKPSWKKVLAEASGEVVC